MLKELRRKYNQMIAFMLIFVMTFTNVGSNLTVAFAAGETEEALFLVEGSELRSAIDDALDTGDVFELSTLELKAKSRSLKNAYDKLLGTRSGNVYLLDVDIDDSYAPDDTYMEVFYNVGTEDVVFLFINESDMIVTFRANVGGYETHPVTINPNNVNVEDAVEATFVEDYSNVTMVEDVPKALGAVLIPSGEKASEEAVESSEVLESIEEATEIETTEKVTGSIEESIGTEAGEDIEKNLEASTEDVVGETEIEESEADDAEAEEVVVPESGSVELEVPETEAAVMEETENVEEPEEIVEEEEETVGPSRDMFLYLSLEKEL